MAVKHNRAVPDASHVTLHSASASQTHRLGALLGGLLRPGDVVLLEGPLGAGKTALTQGIGAGLGVRETINSPTFTLLKEYTGRLPLHHFDLYRIEDPEELFTLGFEDYFSGDGVCVVEWADRGISGGWCDALARKLAAHCHRGGWRSEARADLRCQWRAR